MKDSRGAIAALRNELLPGDSGMAREYFDAGARAALESLAVCPYADCREVCKPIDVRYYDPATPDAFKCPCCGQEWAFDLAPPPSHLGGEEIRADGTAPRSAH